MAAATQAAAEAEVADRKKIVRENLTEDGSMVKVLLIKPNQAAPLVKSVRESNWKSDMDALLGRSAVFSDSVELVSTETSRVMVWFNGDDAGAENQLATLALGGAQLLARGGKEVFVQEVGTADTMDIGERLLTALFVGKNLMRHVPDPNWFRSRNTLQPGLIVDACEPSRLPDTLLGINRSIL